MSIKIRYNISQWDHLKLNYWGITKCGNTSVKYSLIQSSGLKNVYKKADASGADSWIHNEKNAKYIDRETALKNGYLNFTVVRNPYDRFLSMYKDVLRRGPHFFKKKAHNIKSPSDLLDFISKIPDHKREVHFRSQCYFITNEKGDLLVDKIIDVNNASEISDITKFKIETKNSIQKNITLDEKDRKRVYEIYKNDFNKLGYEK